MLVVIIACSLCYVYPSIFSYAFLGVNLFLRFRPISKYTGCVLVGGDYARSPRMQYHTLSLIKSARVECVHVLAYGGSSPPCGAIGDLVKENKVVLHLVNVEGSRFKRLLFSTLWLLVELFFIIPRCNFILVQNPPAIPTLGLVWLCSWVTGAKTVIDWHNLGHTILKLSHPPPVMVTVYSKVEYLFGNGAVNLCVSEALQQHLRQHGISAVVLRDKAPQAVPFRRITNTVEKLTFLQKLYQAETKLDMPTDTFTLVMSCSWTKDDETDLLIDAMKILKAKSARHIWLVATGKGETKKDFQDKIKTFQLEKHVTVTFFSSYDDYAKALGSCDLGVCVHRSSSGYDLPMKVVDMFGCGLPVMALRYPCLGELVEEGRSGWQFDTADELADKVLDVIRNPNVLEGMSTYVCSTHNECWEKQWEKIMVP
eukprot:PhF_6_TR29207/c0_g1_i1/m.42733/K03842/ALG1; beta-1,4-mannosyltransferase